MNLKSLVLISALGLVLIACNQKSKETVVKGNPPAEGFDLADSDPAAIELADSIMAAMGGRSNWDNTRFISWSVSDRNFVWDKQNGRARIELKGENAIYLINVNAGGGKAQSNGEELTQPDSLKKRLALAKRIWESDSYSLFMPFELKGKGITLEYQGEDSLMNGGRCNVLKVISKNPEDTTKNKYEVYVDLTDNLVKQWAYFPNANRDSAAFVLPWDNYQKYGSILLSADRSDGNGPKNVKVDAELPDKVFTDF